MKTMDVVRVLLVEDDEDDFVLVRESLEEIERVRFELDWVQSFDAALERLQENEYAAVLTDYRLGARSGLELVRSIVERGSPSPVIVLTGQGNPEVDLEATEAGAADYLVKSEITSAVLDRSLRYAMRQHGLLKQIQALSLRDELTGLYNRRGFFEVAERKLRLAARRGEELVLLFVDLDGMKGINDSLGHEAGDRALRETTALLTRSFRATDVIARLGGDEFVALAVDACAVHARMLVNRLEEGLERLNAGDGREYRLALSMGVQVYSPAEPCSLETILHRADLAMYEQKQHRKRSAAA